MNLKKNLLLLTSVSTLTAAAIVSLGFPNVSRASSLNSPATNITIQDLLGKTPLKKTPQILLESPSKQISKGIGKATYMLEDPAVQFTYEPSSFVLSEEGPSEEINLQTSAISLWSKADYLTIENAGDELGDFPNKLKLATYSNPDGIPVVDWLSSSLGASFGMEVENLSQQPNTTVAGQDAWTFSYQSLFEYEGVAFQDRDGQMIVITAYKPPANSAIEGNENYSAALLTMVESMALTMPVSE